MCRCVLKSRKEYNGLELFIGLHSLTFYISYFFPYKVHYNGPGESKDRHSYCWVLWDKCIFLNLAPKGPYLGPQDPSHPKNDCCGPGESIDTHIVRFCEKSADFWIWGQRALGPKIWPRGPNHLKNDCWGPGESLDTHIVRFCEKIADFLIWGQRVLGSKIWPGVQII